MMSSIVLKSLNILNFKNWEECALLFSESINCFLGPNGVGKTNLIDAIHYLCTTKSFLTHTDAHMIRQGSDFVMIKGLFDRSGQEDEILLSLKKNEKKVLKRNDVEYTKLSDHIGLLPVVVISPMDSNLIHEGSEERRKVTDLILSLADGLYLHHLLRYNRLLQQRNAYLKEAVPSRKLRADILGLYDEQMEPLAAYIHEARQTFWGKTKKWLSDFYYKIAETDERVSIQYQSDLDQGPLGMLLEQSIQRDTEVLYTSKGIHRDDLEMHLNGNPIKKFGSQGQQKSFLIAMKLAMYAVLKEKTALPPILLFDDIFDKLDQERTKHVIRLVREMKFGQVFLTDTHPERSMQLAGQFDVNACFYHIRADQKVEKL